LQLEFYTAITKKERLWNSSEFSQTKSNGKTRFKAQNIRKITIGIKTDEINYWGADWR
jgi:hypothetical protein